MKFGKAKFRHLIIIQVRAGTSSICSTSSIKQKNAALANVIVTKHSEL